MTRSHVVSRFAAPLIFAASILAACTPAKNDAPTVTPTSTNTPPTPVASSSAGAAKTTEGTTTAPTATTGPGWTLNGTRIPIKTALMKSYGGKMRELFLANEALTCDDIAKHGTMMHTGKIMMIRIAPAMKEKTAPIVYVMYPTSDNNVSTKQLKEHSLKMPPAAVQGVVTLPLDFNFKEDAFDPRPEQVVSVKGPVEIKDCGVFPSSTDGEPMAEPKLGVEVAGERVEIKSALLLPNDKEPRLILSSEANGCNRDAFSDVTLEFRYKGSSALGFVVLMGNRLESAHQTSLESDLKKIKTKLPAKLPKPGSKLEIPMDGEVTLPSDLKVKLSGSLTALVCK